MLYKHYVKNLKTIILKIAIKYIDKTYELLYNITSYFKTVKWRSNISVYFKES